MSINEIDLEDTTLQFRHDLNIDALKKSLDTEGQLNPVSVLALEDRYRLVDGFRGTSAAKQLGWTEIHAAIYPAMSDEDAKKLAFVKNVVRKNLTSEERANAVQLARREGCGVDEVAKLFGVSPRTVRRYLELEKEATPIQLTRSLSTVEVHVSREDGKALHPALVRWSVSGSGSKYGLATPDATPLTLLVDPGEVRVKIQIFGYRQSGRQVFQVANGIPGRLDCVVTPVGVGK